MSTKQVVLLLFIFSSFHSIATENIVFIGDSLTEGYQLPKEYAFPALIQEKINSDEKKDYKVINGGVSGSTSASGPSRLKWFLKSKPKILVLALGANDGLRGLDLKVMESNISAVIEKAKEENIIVVLAGMQIPPNYGAAYSKEFNAVFERLRKKYKTHYVPFLLEGVAGVKKLNLPDGIHPNKEGYVIVANNVYKILEPLL